MKRGLLCAFLAPSAVAMSAPAAIAGEESPVTLVRTTYLPEILGGFDHFNVDLKRGHLFVSAEVHHQWHGFSRAARREKMRA
jgi:hypothetical protein